MGTGLRLFRLEPSSTSNEVTVTDVYSDDAAKVFRREYTTLLPLASPNLRCLVGYDPDKESVDFYRLSDEAPWIRYAATAPIGKNWDLIDGLVLGNQAHLMCYRAKTGVFGFFPVSDGLTTTPNAFDFYRTHEPGITTGFTTARSFTSQNRVGFLGYNGDSGHVAMYTLDVVASSPSNTPPLSATCVWSHQWAKGWTRFAFFQLGDETFFLKTNTWRPNVNIDHVLDNLPDGTVEVATQMSLDDSQDLTFVKSFTLDHCDPYFVTYKSDGITRIYRFHSDCKGWTPAASLATIEGAKQVVATQAQGKAYLLFC